MTGYYFKAPYGVDVPAGARAEESEAVVSAPVKASSVVTEDDEPAPAASEPVVVPKSTSSDKAQDILAMIRARQQKG